MIPPTGLRRAGGRTISQGRQRPRLFATCSRTIAFSWQIKSQPHDAPAALTWILGCVPSTQVAGRSRRLRSGRIATVRPISLVSVKTPDERWSASVGLVALRKKIVTFSPRETVPTLRKKLAGACQELAKEHWGEVSGKGRVRRSNRPKTAISLACRTPTSPK